MKYLPTIIASILVATPVAAQTDNPILNDPVLNETARQWYTGEFCNRGLSEDDLRLMTTIFNYYSRKSASPRLVTAVDLMSPQDKRAWHYGQLLVTRTELCVMHVKFSPDQP